MTESSRPPPFPNRQRPSTPCVSTLVSGYSRGGLKFIPSLAWLTLTQVKATGPLVEGDWHTSKPLIRVTLEAVEITNTVGEK